MIIILSLLPLYILRGKASILIWDNLDSEIPFLKVLANHKDLFGNFDATIPQIMNGIPRNCLNSEFNLLVWLYRFADPTTAYLINETLTRLAAFIGMFLLIRRFFLKNDRETLAAFGASTTFAFLPFMPGFGLSEAGVPLALYAFLRIRGGGKKLTAWLILSLMPFYSSFVMSFSFLISLLFALWIYDCVRTKKINGAFLSALVLMTSIFLMVEYRLVYQMFLNPTYTSHRVEFNPLHDSYDFIGMLGKTAQTFFNGGPHTKTFAPLIIVSLLIVFAASRKQKNRLNMKIALTLFTLCFGIAAFYALWGWRFVAEARADVVILRTFQFDRFYFLLPSLFYILFGLSLSYMAALFRRGKKIAALLIICQLLVLSASNTVLAGVLMNHPYPTYNQFFAEDIFGQIKNFIGEKPETYKVISVALEPAVPLYNGFYALDGYWKNYPLEYKHTFKKIIDKELDKSPRRREYFNYWGNRCYIFASELDRDGYTFSKNENKKIKKLELDMGAVRNLGGKYVLAGLEIVNYKENGLAFLKSFETPTSFYKIYLYKIQ